MTTFNDLLTFTRNSPAWAYDRFGDLSEHAIDAHRLQHDPASVTTSSTTIDFDALVKGDSVLIDLPGSDTFAAGQDISVTDSSDINRYLTAKVEFSSPGSVQVTVKTINGTGTGSSYTLIRNLGLLIEEERTRLNTIAAAPTSPENVTVTAAAHTISFFGTGTVDLTGAATETLVGTGADDRVTLTFTPTAGTLTITPSGTVTDVQLEAGSFATSVIRGEGSQFTREADSCSRTLGAEFNADGFTLFVEGIVGESSFSIPLGATDGSTSNRLTTSLQNNGEIRLLDIGPLGLGRTIDSADTGSRAGDKIRMAYSFDGSQIVVYLNGTEYFNTTVQSADPSLFSELSLSSVGGGIVPSLTSRRSVYPRALSAAELEPLTAPDA